MNSGIRYAFPAHIREEEGTWIVQFRDVQGATTGDDTEAAAWALAQDCLETALGGYVTLRQDIPVPSRRRTGERVIAISPLVAAKLALYQAMRDQGVTKVALARRLGTTESLVRRLVDPGHRSHIDAVTDALAALGQELVVQIQPTPKRANPAEAAA